jgi:DNA helicase TIP49 (TBP-interacting protein)
MAEEKLTIEGLVVELKKVERVTDGGVQTSYEAKIQARGDEGENVVKIKSNLPINLVEGEVVQIKAIQIHKSLNDFTEPKVN